MKTAIELGHITASTVISEMGGTGSVAALLKIKPPSVSEWRINNSIPDDKLIRLAPQRIGKINPLFHKNRMYRETVGSST